MILILSLCSKFVELKFLSAKYQSMSKVSKLRTLVRKKIRLHEGQRRRLASVAGAVIQATGRTELEDGTRPGGRLNRLHAHCGVCTSPTVMLNPLWGMAWL